MDTTPLPIPFEDFMLEYATLPQYYPKLPLNALQQQPAAYTQGTLERIYVTIVVPLPGNLFIDLPVQLSYIDGGEVDTYFCGIQLTNTGVSDVVTASGRLAIISFSVVMDGEMSAEGQWKITVNNPENKGIDLGRDSLGKVVMDSNILPTFPEDKKA
jgi:hypothetical protein